MDMRSVTRRVTQATALAAVALVALPASSWAWGYGRNVVKDSAGVITVHATAPNGSPSGPYIGALKNPQTFDVEKAVSNNFWCYGFAYGNVNQHGWVQCDQLQLP
jgi:hypothetical protein